MNYANLIFLIMSEVNITHQFFLEEEDCNKSEDVQIESLEQLKDELSILLAENSVAWQEYGSYSERAQKNPHSIQLSTFWNLAKLSVILPNNRRMKELLNENRRLFPRSEQVVISKFLHHVITYEKWVDGDMDYSLVVGFPNDFVSLILEE